MSSNSLYQTRLKEINDEINGQAQLLAVSKRSTSEDIRILYRLGQRHFGENRLQDLLKKERDLEDLDDIVWHFIGHIQSKKLTEILKVPKLKYIHSIDSMKILTGLYENSNSRADLKYFLQINTSNEEQKYGLKGNHDLNECLNYIVKNKGEKGPQLEGLMTMGKIRTEDFEGDARVCFQKLHQIRSQVLIDWPLDKLGLSMGMSNDYKIALALGTDWIRLGSSLF